MPDATGASQPAVRVSVVLATNRGGPYLTEALASVAAQTYPHVELILVDDGAEAPAAIEAIAALFPEVRLTHIKPSGVAVARNVGVSRTSGDVLAFLDDDDRWHPERVERHVDAMLRTPDAVVSYCGMRVVDERGVEVAPADQRAVRDVHDVYRRSTGIMAPNLMIRRDAFTRVGGFSPAFRQAEDLDLVLRAAREGPFAFVEGTLVDYRKHGGNTTRGHRELAGSIREVLRLHRWAALERGDGALAADLRYSLDANARFAAWSAARAARADLRERAYSAAVGEVAWAASFAPSAPWSWLRRRLGRTG